MCFSVQAGLLRRCGVTTAASVLTRHLAGRASPRRRRPPLSQFWPRHFLRLINALQHRPWRRRVRDSRSSIRPRTEPLMRLTADVKRILKLHFLLFFSPFTHDGGINDGPDALPAKAAGEKYVIFSKQQLRPRFRQRLLLSESLLCLPVFPLHI